MKKTILTAIIITFFINCLAVIRGNLHDWSLENFLGFDTIGDCEQADIAGVYAREDDGDFILRITFDDMITREHNRMIRDNFAGSSLSLNIALSDENKLIYHQEFSLTKISGTKEKVQFLRTPQYNLLEIAFDHSFPEDSQIEISTAKDDLILDEYVTRLNGEYRGGNCAFVHHGNQGLTYTEVFYGQYPHETSGFDEVLEVHELTGIPGNFHMSGTLIPAAQWHNPEFNDWLHDGAAQGYVAMLTSALGQHIMPFLQNDMNNWSVAIENDMVDYRYDYFPKIAWVPERVWLTPGVYPEAGVIDWLGDNWMQHGVEAVILDDSPHCDGHSNYKIHWMNNGSGIVLRVIPINNEFVGNMHYNADAAKNQISNTGQYGICVYGTDWEVAAEMNQHNGTFFLDNYENVLWYCYDNYPAISVWKLDEAIYNSDFNGEGLDIVNGTYYLLGGYEGYGYANNSWYVNWASTASHSDFHQPPWTYGFVWDNAYNNLLDCPNNSLAQLGWYTLMINLHETGWHDNGQISGWEHRYSSHMKNANVYAEASRWANGEYNEPTGAFENDIDRDGINELIIHNEDAYFVFEHIGGKANWIFARDDLGNMYSVVGSDVAYFSETEGDYNESSNNHVAALSEVSPNFQHDDYQFEVVQASGNEVEINLTRQFIQKNCKLQLGNKYLEVEYSLDGNDVYIRSGWTPDLLDLIWSGKANIQRMWGNNGSYCGRRNSASGATAAYVLGNGGASHSTEFEGTLVLGDEIFAASDFKIFLYAGRTSDPYDPNFNQTAELDSLASILDDTIPPEIVLNVAMIAAENKAQIVFTEPVTMNTALNLSNYQLSHPGGSYTLLDAELSHERKVILTIDETFLTGIYQSAVVSNITDMNGNVMIETEVELLEIIKPHLVGSFNNWIPDDHDHDLVLQDNGTWKTTIDLSVGSHEYKVLESDGWNGHDWPPENQGFQLTEPTEVEFVANCGIMLMNRNGDEYVFHSTNPPVVCGDFLSELGGTDWNELTTLTQMHDDGLSGDIAADDGIYTFLADIPAGSYEYKIVLNNNWDQDPTPNNLQLNLPDNADVTFEYDMSENQINVSYILAGDDQIVEPDLSEDIITSVYPNPFNPNTTIYFSTTENTKSTELVIYNLKGQKIRQFYILDDQSSIIWDGMDRYSKPVSSGVYLLQLKIGDRSADVRKCLLLK